MGSTCCEENSSYECENNRVLNISCNNIDIEVKEICPIRVYESLFLSLKVDLSCNSSYTVNASIYPSHGELYLENNGLVIYIPNRGYRGYDIFQILVENESCRRGIENVVVYVM